MVKRPPSFSRCARDPVLIAPTHLDARLGEQRPLAFSGPYAAPNWFHMNIKETVTMPNCPPEFVGTWFLQAMTLPGAKTLPPFLEKPYGVIVYAADGFMSTTVSASFNGDAAADPASPIPYEKTMHYAGFWEVEGDAVIHTIAFSPNPAEVGITRGRQFRIAGDDIFLTDGSFESHYRRKGPKDTPSPIVVKAP